MMIFDRIKWKQTMPPCRPIWGFARWLCILVIAVLSVIPGQERPHTGLPGQGEHFIAYFLVSFLLGIQRDNAAYHVILIIALCAYAGFLEILQIWIPSRSAQLIDFAAGSFGVFSGMLMAAVFLRFWQKAVRNRNRLNLLQRLQAGQSQELYPPHMQPLNDRSPKPLPKAALKDKL